MGLKFQTVELLLSQILSMNQISRAPGENVPEIPCERKVPLAPADVSYQVKGKWGRKRKSSLEAM